MAHKHSVHDADPHFVIDGVSRTVKNASSAKTMVVQNDHNSERFTFELPRMIDDHDMSACNVVQVHYLNIDSKTKEQNAGVYEVDDLAVNPDDKDSVVCSWLISNNATRYEGFLNFLVRFACVTEGTVDYAWNTAIHSGVLVSPGIYNGNAVAEEYADVLEQWRYELIEKGGATDEQIAQAVASYLDSHPIETGSTLTIGHVDLLASNWTGSASPYAQVVTIPGVTAYSQVDLTPSVEQLAIFHDKDLAFVAENEDGVVTVYAIGDKPLNDYTMQVTIKEVNV